MRVSDSVSFVVPTTGTRSRVAEALGRLLTVLQRYNSSASELLLISTLPPTRLRELAGRALATLPGRGLLAQLRLLHWNGTSIGAGMRYAAAANAANEVIFHLDDDVIPSWARAEQLAALVRARPEGIYGLDSRACDPKGYRMLRPPRHADGLVTEVVSPRGFPVMLTRCLATSRTLTRRFLRSWETDYHALLVSTAGNGDDIVFNHWAHRQRRVGRRRVPVAHVAGLYRPPRHACTAKTAGIVTNALVLAAQALTALRMSSLQRMAATHRGKGGPTSPRALAFAAV